MIHSDKPYFPTSTSPKTTRVLRFQDENLLNEYIHRHHGEVTSMTTVNDGRVLLVAISAYHLTVEEDPQ